MALTLKDICWATLIAIGFARPIAAGPLIGEATLQAAGLTRHWSAELPLDPHDSIKEGYLIDEALYVITEGGTFFAMKADVGLIRWAEKLAAEDFRIYKPTHLRRADGAGSVVILTTSEGNVYDRFTGDLIQVFKPEFDLGSPPVGFDRTVLMGSANGRVYSLWLGDPATTRPVTRWEVSAGGPVTAAPVLYAHDKVLLASHAGRVFSCYAWDKTFDWHFAAGGPILESPAVDESGVYVASMDRSLYKLHRDSGTMIWRKRFPCELADGPVVAAHVVYQYCQSQGLTAIDADTGEQKWRLPTGRTFAAHASGRDVAFTKDRRVLVVDRDGGEVLHRLAVESAVGAVTNTHDDAVYLLGCDGRVLCIRPVGTPYLRRQEAIAAQQRLNLRPAGEGEAPRAALLDTSGESEPVGEDPLRSKHNGQP